MGRKKEEPEKKESTNEDIPRHERIASLSILLENITSKSLDLFLIFSFVFGGVFYLITISPELTDSEIQKQINISTYLFLYPAIICMIIAFSGLITSSIHLKFRKYDMNEAIRDLFYELAEKPERKRQRKVLNLLNYNLDRKMRIATNNGFLIISSGSIRAHHYFIKRENLMRAKITCRVMNIINEPTTYWLDFDYGVTFKKIGDAFFRRDYKTILETLEDNRYKFTQFDKFIEDFEKTNIRGKLKRFGSIISQYFKELLYAISSIVIICYYLSNIL